MVLNLKISWMRKKMFKCQFKFQQIFYSFLVFFSRNFSFHNFILNLKAFYDLPRRMLKAPPLIPWAYISRSSKIGLKEGHLICSKNMFKKSSTIRKAWKCCMPDKKGQQWYMPDNGGTCLSNILYSSDFLILDRYWHHRSDNYILLPKNFGLRK